jgi:hypothetical protein
VPLSLVNIGATPGDGTGDSGQIPFTKVNAAINCLNGVVVITPSSAIQIGAPASGTGPAITIAAATNWQSAAMSSTLQLTGPGKITNANQVVTTTQLMLHGQSAEFVSINGSAGADEKVWSYFANSDGTYNFRIENDALSATFTWLQIARSGAFSGDQPTTIFSNGHGAVTFATTSSNGYQATINAGSVAGFANGLNIIAGSNSADNALLIQNQGQTANFVQISGQGAMTIGTTGATGLIPLTVKGIASDTSPTASFGGATSNFINVTDGTIVTQVGTSTGLPAGFLGTSSNHQLFINTNGVVAITISTSQAVKLAGFFAANGATPAAAPTGYGTPTGGSHQTSFSASGISLANLGAAVAQLIIDLKGTGLIAT